jgi:hypothetical protein
VCDQKKNGKQIPFEFIAMEILEEQALEHGKTLSQLGWFFW